MKRILLLVLGLALCGCPEHTNRHLQIAAPHPEPGPTVLATR